MGEREPVELWKGIVGTALSGGLLLILTPFCFILTFYINDSPLWLTVTILICAFVCFFTLIISLHNLASAIQYRKAQRTERNKTAKNKKTDNVDKFEEIRKYKELLDEGIITLEEFDAKKKELLD